MKNSTAFQPNDLPSLGELRRLEIVSRRSATAASLGELRSSFRGHGLDFADLREYIPGDDVKRIHWKVTARTGRAFVKTFEEERRLRIHVALDVTASLAGGSERSGVNRSMQIAALLTAFAVRNRDSVSLSLFGDQNLKFIPAGSSRYHLRRVLTEMAMLSELPTKTNIDAECKFLSEALKQRGIVFIISDFMSAPFIKSLRRLTSRHEVIGICVPTFEEIPKSGIVYFTDPETAERVEVDTDYEPSRRAMQAAIDERNRKLTLQFAQTGAVFTSYQRSALHTLLRVAHLKRSMRR